MQRLLLYAWVILAYPALVHAQAALPVAATISGHLDNAPADDTVRLRCGSHWVRAALDAAGNFQLTVALAEATSADLSYARQHAALYLTPGDTLRLTLDYPRFGETLRYTGRGAAANNYLARSHYAFADNSASNVARPLQEVAAAAQTTPARMRAYADAFRRKRQAFLTACHQATPLPLAFRQQQALDINLEWGCILLQYPGYRRYHHPKAGGLPATYYNFLRQLPLHALNAQLAREPGPVVRFLQAYSDQLLAGGTLPTDPTAARRLYAQATADFGTGPVRDRAVFEVLLAQLEDSDAKSVLAAYPTFRVENQDSTLARLMHAQLRRRTALLPGQLAPAFRLTSSQGQVISLAELQGKVVYLDFWGTWCAPCMRELTEFSYNLRKQFEGRDVVFVYVAVGDKAEKWQQVLAEKQLVGPNTLHLLSADDAVPAAYQVTGFPTYWFIGRDGRIIQRNAPPPSAGTQTVAAIEQALRK